MPLWLNSDRVIVAEFEEQERDAKLAAMDVSLEPTFHH